MLFILHDTSTAIRPFRPTAAPLAPRSDLSADGRHGCAVPGRPASCLGPSQLHAPLAGAEPLSEPPAAVLLAARAARVVLFAARWWERVASCRAVRIGATVVVAHRDGHHLPRAVGRPRALGDKDGVQVEHAAVRHHHPGIASKRNRSLLKARLWMRCSTHARVSGHHRHHLVFGTEPSSSSGLRSRRATRMTAHTNSSSSSATLSTSLSSEPRGHSRY
jgi:hypothetical protein